jgi:hypothetical protein
MKVKDRHQHISEMRVKVNKRLFPNLKREELQTIVSDILNGLPAPDGIIIQSFDYGQTTPNKDGLDMLSRGDFGFIDTNAGFSASTRKVKK